MNPVTSVVALSSALRRIALIALLLVSLAVAWLFRNGERPEPERAAEAPLPRVGLGVPRAPAPPPEPVVSATPAVSPEPVEPAEPEPPALERILTVPEDLAARHGERPLERDYTPAEPLPGEQSLTPDWVDPSLSGESRRIEGLSPRDDIESREVRGGVTVSPGKSAEGRGPAAITVEGGAREDLNKGTGREGVSIEVPWPGERKP
jgi:cbb3-type cytochrome oxidase subunit 3